MVKPVHHKSGLPELDRTDDPRGGAAGWALVAVGASLMTGIVVVALWATGAW